MRYSLSILLCFSLLQAGSLDTYYHNMKQWIADKLKSLDIFMSDSNESLKQHFSIRASIDTIEETKRDDLQFKFNFRANLDFPRTQKRLHLFIQDYKRQESIDEATGENLQDSIDNTSFLVGLQYLTKAKIRYRAGVRFHKITPDPFVGIGWENTHYFHKHWLYYGDRLRYFLDRKIDNKLFANYQYKISPIDIFSFENSYRYRQEPQKEHQVIHALKVYHSLGKRSILIPRAEVYCYASNSSSYRLDYIYLGFDYEDTIYRKWLFFRIAPAVLWRYENDFAPSYRIMFRFGITFEQN